MYKEGDIIKFYDSKRKEKIGYIIYIYGDYYHVMGFRPRKQYYINKKDIITNL